MIGNAEKTRSDKIKEISISFGKIEKENISGHYIVLRNPNRYIPQHIEDVSDFILELNFGLEKRKVKVESCQVKEYSLKIKLENIAEIEGLDLGLVTDAKIKVKSADFLLEALLECFQTLKLEESHNLKEGLPENLEFVFGPPGTGKTTYLAKNVLIPLMNDSEDKKVLVLAPTNKAVDVLTSRIIEEMKGNKDYENWLFRFGATPNEELEKLQVVKDRTFNLERLAKEVVVTTASRFTYDFTANEFGSKNLFDLNWDYIVIDEASMIHIPSIIFAIYKRHPKKIIIAGDPFQIGPIA